MDNSISKEVEDRVHEYIQSLEKFCAIHGLPDLLNNPIDHFAIKLKNTHEYEKFLHDFLPLTNQAHYVEMNGRRITTAQLIYPIKGTQLFEIMEPKPEKANKDFTGLEHAEIVVQNLKEMENFCRNRGIIKEVYDNGSHKAVVLQINEKGQELKLSNISLAEIIKTESALGKLIIIK